jgi:hypothetical protein
MVEISLSKIAPVLTAGGAALMVVYGAAALIGYTSGWYLDSLGIAFGGSVSLVCAFIAIIGAVKLDSLKWSIILIIVGVAGGNAGGFLVVIGGVIGLMQNTYPQDR